MKELETAPEIQTVVVGIIKSVRSGNNPISSYFSSVFLELSSLSTVISVTKPVSGG